MIVTLIPNSGRFSVVCLVISLEDGNVSVERIGLGRILLSSFLQGFVKYLLFKVILHI